MAHGTEPDGGTIYCAILPPQQSVFNDSPRVELRVVSEYWASAGAGRALVAEI